MDVVSLILMESACQPFSGKGPHLCSKTDWREVAEAMPPVLELLLLRERQVWQAWEAAVCASSPIPSCSHNHLIQRKRGGEAAGVCLFSKAGACMCGRKGKAQAGRARCCQAWQAASCCLSLHSTQPQAVRGEGCVGMSCLSCPPPVRPVCSFFFFMYVPHPERVLRDYEDALPVLDQGCFCAAVVGTPR